MKKTIFFFVLLSLVIGINACIEIDNKFSALPPGPWRGVFKLPLNEGPESIKVLDEKEKEYSIQKNYRELPFIFNVVYHGKDSFNIEIINGEEKIMVSDIVYALDRSTAKDTLTINFPAYDTYIKAIYEENFIEGAWYVNYKENYSIPFIAYQGKNQRFKVDPKEPTTDLNGEWEVSFDYDKGENAYPAVGVFKQDGDKLTGTFKTETGDYRFLEGTVSDKKFYLSVFDGSHAFLFEGKETAKDELTGIFYSGKHYQSNWIAKRSTSSALELTSPYNLSKSTTDEAISFSFPNSKGQTISLDDQQYQGKAKLINVMGTWCPNCRDEANFLKENYGKIQEKGIEVISLAFERYRDDKKSLAAVKRYEETMQIPWQMLYAGYFNKSEASETLPFVDKVISYPTLFFVNKDNEIIKIHTGFNGPATAEYEDFKSEFFEIINTIQ